MGRLGCQEGELRCQEGELRCQEGELRCREAELRCREAELRCREAELRCREAELRYREGELRYREGELRYREGELRCREGELRCREGELRCREAELRCRVENTRKKRLIEWNWQTTPTEKVSSAQDLLLNVPLLHRDALPVAFSFKNRTHPGPVETQTEPVFLRELLDLCFSIFFVQRPNALQFVLVNCAMSPFSGVQ
jgi:hypothetical protein